MVLLTIAALNAISLILGVLSLRARRKETEARNLLMAANIATVRKLRKQVKTLRLAYKDAMGARAND